MGWLSWTRDKAATPDPVEPAERPGVLTREEAEALYDREIERRRLEHLDKPQVDYEPPAFGDTLTVGATTFRISDIVTVRDGVTLGESLGRFFITTFAGRRTVEQVKTYASWWRPPEAYVEFGLVSGDKITLPVQWTQRDAALAFWLGEVFGPADRDPMGRNVTISHRYAPGEWSEVKQFPARLPPIAGQRVGSAA